jgi:hypothetical protein
MLGIISLLSKFYLQAADQPWDIPGIEDKPQEFVDEDQINEAFEPANNAFSGLRDAGDWIINWFSEVFGQLFGNIL